MQGSDIAVGDYRTAASENGPGQAGNFAANLPENAVADENTVGAGAKGDVNGEDFGIHFTKKEHKAKNSASPNRFGAGREEKNQGLSKRNLIVLWPNKIKLVKRPQGSLLTSERLSPVLSHC